MTRKAESMTGTEPPLTRDAAPSPQCTAQVDGDHRIASEPQR